ncbi:UNVERIFIED_CONTAM: hypothetical protein Sindi_2026700 [Sesamum indicum]
MSTGTPPTPCSRGRDYGPPLPPVPSDASHVGEAFFRPPIPPNTPAPSPASQTPDDARAFGAAQAADDTLQQPVNPAAAPPPPPSAPAPSSRQYIILDDAM